jgi:membrane associated rhomboid family serine protease
MTRARASTVTPWVGRLAFAGVAAWVLLRTVFTTPAIAQVLRFDPEALGTRPWSVVTYPFVHEGALHVAATTLLLLLLGPAVERRMGARGFLLYWVYGTIGAAFVAMLLSFLVAIPPMVGALAPVLALLVARAWYTGDAEVSLDPLPVRLPVRVVLALGGLAVLTAGLLAREPALSVAHAGGLAAGWLFFRVRQLGPRPQPALPLPVRRQAMAPIRLTADAPVATESASPGVTPAPARRAADATADEVNRVLDKISASGMESLTPDERRILTQYAARKREGR